MWGLCTQWYDLPILGVNGHLAPLSRKQVARLSSSNTSLPDGLLITWYGDDFTGAAAVMEVLTFAGLPSVLFLDVPTPEDLERFRDVRAIGVASIARTMSSTEIASTVPQVLKSLSGLNAQIIHYKVCTTLDSSTEIGSIGCALEHGAEALGVSNVPILIAAPQMRRYQSFGHLFASFNEHIYRLDKHPVMQVHPITPMSESDVAAHLAPQAPSTTFGVVTLEHLQDSNTTLQDSFKQINASTNTRYAALTLDCVDQSSEEAIGRLLWDARSEFPFMIGSQGIEYALVRHWQSQGMLPIAPATQGIGIADRMIIVSGSVSKTTAQQIDWSRNNGFDCIRFNASSACESNKALDKEIDIVTSNAMKSLQQGTDPLIYTAEGPDDPVVAKFNEKLSASGGSAQAVNKLIGEALGEILSRLITSTGVRRVVISGGDTSGYATQCLGIYALTALAPTVPAAPIFKAHAHGEMDGLEIALKGGQMGSPDYFGWVKAGGGQR